MPVLLLCGNIKLILPWNFRLAGVGCSKNALASFSIHLLSPLQVYRNDADESKEGQPAMAHPADFHLVFRENGRSPVTMWEPVAPEGYAHIHHAKHPVYLSSPSSVCVCHRVVRDVAPHYAP